jgi:cobalt-zinc-cadmium efflux system outer membrane protein
MRRSAALLALGFVLIGPPAWAEPAPSLRQLLAATAGAPKLMEATAEVDAAKGREQQAQAWRNPELSLQTENFQGEGPLSAFNGAETTLSVAQTFELGGKRQARTAAARASVSVAEATNRGARSDYVARLAVTYAEAEASARRVDLAQSLLDAALTDARATKLLVDAGKQAQLRTLQAEAETQGARAELAEAQATKVTAFARLTALAGWPRPLDSVSESVLDASLLPATRAPGVNPKVAAAGAERTAAEARLSLERRQAIPDVRLSAGVRRFEADGSTALVAGVSLPLPIFDRNRGGVQAAQAELRAAEARGQQAKLDANADLQSAGAQASSAEARVTAAAAGEAAADEAYRGARLGYDAGRLPLLELSSARRALATARAQRLDAQLASVRAQADLLRLTGATPYGN